MIKINGIRVFEDKHMQNPNFVVMKLGKHTNFLNDTFEAEETNILTSHKNKLVNNIIKACNEINKNDNGNADYIVSSSAVIDYLNDILSSEKERKKLKKKLNKIKKS